MELARSAGSVDVERQHLALRPRPTARRVASASSACRRMALSSPSARACRSPCAGRTAGAPAACRSISGSGSRPRGRSSPSRACAGRPSCAPRARARWRRRRRAPAASSGPSANRTWRRRRPSRPCRTACSRARRRNRPSAAPDAWPRHGLAEAGMSLTTPEAVSICTTSSALILWPCRAFSRCLDRRGSTARRKSPCSTSTSTPSICAISPQPTREAARSPAPAPCRRGRARW